MTYQATFHHSAGQVTSIDSLTRYAVVHFNKVFFGIVESLLAESNVTLELKSYNLISIAIHVDVARGEHGKHFVVIYRNTAALKIPLSSNTVMGMIDALTKNAILMNGLKVRTRNSSGVR